MGIKIEGDLFYIETENSSMIIERRHSDLLLKHLGKKISHYHFSNTVHERDHAFSGNPDPNVRTYSYDTQRQVLGVHGFGDFRHSALVLQHRNNDLSQFKFTQARIIEGVAEAGGLPNPYSAQGAETLELSLFDQVSQTSVKLYYTTYPGESTLSTFLRVENHSQETVVLHRILSAMCDLPAAPYDLISLQGAYAREKTVRRQAVEQGIFSISSNRGASGHSQTPAMILCDSQANDYYGEALAFQLIYSGNFQAFVQKNQLNEVRLGIGLNDDNFAWELKPGQSFDTPVALISYSDQGLVALSQESQSFVQDHIIPEKFAKQERPILINNWEATYFDFKKEKLLDLADKASKLGMELFVLDDGWFGQRFDDNRALGDWWVNEEKLGGSLNQLIADIHAKGLKFGLWVEPEMISEDSELYRKYPDWAIQVAGRGHTYSRNQLVLNFANPDVVNFIKLTFDDILRRHDIDYIKWDYNRNITNVGNGSSYLETKMQSHAYMLGLYEVVDYLTKKHPDVLFESCSGGGGRNDLGMMRYFPQVWASDNTDAISRLAIQYGSSYLYPTISMGAHVSAVPNHQMGRITPLETRGHVAMMGNLGYELDLTKLSQSEKQEIAEQVKRYKAIRATVQKGKQYRLLNPYQAANEMALQFNDDQQVVVTYVRILSTIETMETTLKLKGLDPAANYRLVDEDKLYSGAELMYAGLTMALPQGDYLSRQLYFVKEN
ncbi:alpha-galactosidase [Streptococcus sobrinus]|uniref:alpha-galactosidase n=4 Tax=Streptococcus sobrinus TaxID=1310 RepID=UPI00030A51B4|nr:alpha-galactosidase [Streptococcus sobrinus]